MLLQVVMVSMRDGERDDDNDDDESDTCSADYGGASCIGNSGGYADDNDGFDCDQ